MTTFPGTRSRVRDVLVNLAMMMLALLLGLSVKDSLIHGWDGYPHILRTADLVLGIGGFVALWWRRTHPVWFAVYVLVVSTFTTLVSGLTLVAVFTVAEYRRWQVAVPISAGLALSSWPNLAFYGITGTDLQAAAWLTAITTFAFTGWGMFVRARRQLVAALVDKVNQAEADRVSAAERARLAERRRIAREMHDVLAHRLSLLGVYAGGLEFRPDAPPEQIADAARLIRETVHEGLDELRTAIRVLRDTPEDPGRPPSPTLSDVPELVAAARQAGGDVDLDMSDVSVDSVPAQVQRTIYRIVQEGLTNVRKHAPGAYTSVRVVESAPDSLTVSVINTRPGNRPDPPMSGSGAGLVGLGERVELIGGALHHGTRPDGGFWLEAALPLSGRSSDPVDRSVPA